MENINTQILTKILDKKVVGFEPSIDYKNIRCIFNDGNFVFIPLEEVKKKI